METIGGKKSRDEPILHLFVETEEEEVEDETCCQDDIMHESEQAGPG